jgi:probable rRNA maturation factor
VSRRTKPLASAPSAKIPARDISIANRHTRLRIDRARVARVIELLDAHAEEIAGSRYPIPAGELSVAFLDDSSLAQLHDQFLDDPTTTDVITFEGDPHLGSAGEICVSADTAARYAKTHRRDFSSELTLYVVHGWLHLAGHDDLVPLKKRAMRRAEARAMRVLIRENAVPRFAFKSRR